MRFLKLLLMTFVVSVIIIFGAVVVFSTPPHIRPFDANNRPLAESEAEGYCTGFVGWTSRFQENNPEVDQCVAESSLGKEPNIAIVVHAFCRGLVDGGWEGNDVTLCEQIVESEGLWPLLHGGLARPQDFNTARPRPGSGVVQLEKGSVRDTEREGNNRGDDALLPTTTTTTTGGGTE